MKHDLAKQLKDAGFPQLFPQSDKFYTIDTIGATPTEAVARLWFAIHKKS